MGSYKFRKIHKKTPVPESLFNKVANLRPKIKFTSHKQYLFGRFFSIKANKTRTNQSTLYWFLIMSESKRHKPSKEAAAKTFFYRLHVADANIDWKRGPN